jgi:hypothetical protein
MLIKIMQVPCSFCFIGTPLSCREDPMMNWTIYLMLSVLSLYPGSVQLQIMAGILQGSGTGSGQCASAEKRETLRNEILQMVVSAIASTYFCNGSPGWRRIAFINMTDTNHSCPIGLTLTSFSKRTCAQPNSNSRCFSTFFNVGDSPYSQVCGRIRGYQYGASSAFGLGAVGQGIDGHYVGGVSLTHGSPGRRQHIWTFAAGLAETYNGWPDQRCPCDMSADYIVPSFVGNDYFCESGVNGGWVRGHGYYTFYSSDVIWDGQDCIPSSTCCQFNNPPWFTKNLLNATTDDIELRLCDSIDGTGEEFTPLELIELYVH